MLAVSSPSGAGKTSLTRALLQQEAGIALSISATTRPQREREVEGRDYFFVSQERFAGMIEEGALLEHAEIYGQRYGTPKAPVEAALGDGRDVVFDIEWRGAQQLKIRAPHDVVSVFILPPSYREQARRLSARGRDPANVVKARLALAAQDARHWTGYDYVIVNADFDLSLTRLRAILVAERLRRERQSGLVDFVAGFLAEAAEAQVED